MRCYAFLKLHSVFFSVGQSSSAASGSSHPDARVTIKAHRHTRKGSTFLFLNAAVFVSRSVLVHTHRWRVTLIRIYLICEIICISRSQQRIYLSTTNDSRITCPRVAADKIKILESLGHCWFENGAQNMVVIIYCCPSASGKRHQVPRYLQDGVFIFGLSFPGYYYSSFI